MTDCHWQKGKGTRTYLCESSPPPPSGNDFSPYLEEDWIGFVDTEGAVAMRFGQWPNWRYVAQLDCAESEWLDAAKFILLSLKKSEDT